MKKLLIVSLLAAAVEVAAQTGNSSEPVAYVGGEICNPRLHEGGFRYAIGTENIQVLRANRTHPEWAEGTGFTYNHAPNLTYWNGKFYLEYLTSPADEHEPPGMSLLATSKDGRTWNRPVVAFPAYEPPKGITPPEGYTGYMMHQRMGFYTAPNGRLLLLGFYGHSGDPFGKGGIGRVVREIKANGTMGPIYFIRYSSHTSWNESNTSLPFYTKSKDKGFREACDALLKDRLKTLQWLDEDRGLDGFYTLKDSVNTVQATNYYHRKDGKTVALWKWSYAALSDDEGTSWSAPVRCPTLIMAGGKQWGQRTRDGRYAISYNPIETQPYRYPLIIITSDDGITFDSLGIVHGEVPPRRFFGINKDFGPCYVRGITEGEQQPEDYNMWLTYSVNKEDIWVSRVPLPVRTTWDGPVHDDLTKLPSQSPVPDWNVYRSQWAPVYIGDNGEGLWMKDGDRYDYARVIRVFEETACPRLSLYMVVEQEQDEAFEVDLTDRHGTRALSLTLHKGIIEAQYEDGHRINVGSYTVGRPFFIDVSADTASGYATVNRSACPLMHSVKSMERLSLRTGAYRNLPDRQTPNQDRQAPLALCDEPCQESAYRILSLKTFPSSGE